MSETTWWFGLVAWWLWVVSHFYTLQAVSNPPHQSNAPSKDNLILTCVNKGSSYEGTLFLWLFKENQPKY